MVADHGSYNITTYIRTNEKKLRREEKRKEREEEQRRRN